MLHRLTVVFFLLSTVATGQTTTGESLPAPAQELLLDILHDAGLPNARVSSFERTARRQAELMYALVESVGVRPVRAQYESIGDSVVDFYELHRDEAEPDALIEGMARVVDAGVRAEPNREQMMHVLPTNNYTFDVAPSSLAPREDAFVEAILSHAGYDLASYILPGPAERAFHLEVRKTLRTVSGNYSGVCVDRDTSAPISITLDREPHGYVGRYAVYDRSTPLTASVDRRTKGVLLVADIDGTRFRMVGRLDPDHTTLTLDPDSPGEGCRLERQNEQGE